MCHKWDNKIGKILLSNGGLDSILKPITYNNSNSSSSVYRCLANITCYKATS